MEKTDDLLKSISRLAKIPVSEITIDTELYKSEIISSLMLLEMMSALEKEYHIFIRPEELIEDNFKNIGTLQSFIERKLEKEGEIGVMAS
jgi:acyl carrier protein